MLELVTAEALSSLALDPAAEQEASERTSWSEAAEATVAGSGVEPATEGAPRAAGEAPAADVCTTQGPGSELAPPRAEEGEAGGAPGSARAVQRAPLARYRSADRVA